jgi:hypothetical protein
MTLVPTRSSGGLSTGSVALVLAAVFLAGGFVGYGMARR